MFCAISGNVPEQPVVSSKSGHLFEKRLVEKYVRETGKCPVTSESLSVDDLMPLKSNKTVKPRPSPAASIPGLLGLFHDEWDALMLETHTLRTSLHTVRQELSHALYQHDAACRVIARLMRERDEARNAVQNVRQTMQAEFEAEAAKRGAEPADAADDQATKKAKKAGIPDSVLQELTNVNATLSKGRKKRAIPETLATVDELAAASVVSSHPLHKTTAGGIAAIDFNPAKPSIVATAGLDSTVQIFDHVAGRVLGALEGHSKKLSSVAYAGGNVMLTSSADKTARIWSGDSGSYKCSATLTEHTAEVVGLSVHPSNKYFVTGSADASWCFYDIETASCLRQVHDESSAKDPYTVVQFHPDGLILGTGTDRSVIRIWEVKAQKNVASFEGHVKPLRALAFSENGYHLASASDDCVKLWDLRKLKNFKTIEPYEDFPCSTVAFDYTGQYLGIGGADARIHSQKQDWSVVKSFPDMPKKGVLSMKWGPDARSLFVGAADHNLRIVGVAGASTMQE